MAVSKAFLVEPSQLNGEAARGFALELGASKKLRTRKTEPEDRIEKPVNWFDFSNKSGSVKLNQTEKILRFRFRFGHLRFS